MAWLRAVPSFVVVWIAQEAELSTVLRLDVEDVVESPLDVFYAAGIGQVDGDDESGKSSSLSDVVLGRDGDLEQEGGAVIAARVESQVRRGRDYVRVVIVIMAAAADVAEALDAAWWAFRKALCGARIPRVRARRSRGPAVTATKCIGSTTILTACCAVCPSSRAQSGQIDALILLLSALT
jgi:hypothetical protein